MKSMEYSEMVGLNTAIPTITLNINELNYYTEI